jgi:hypothetical protein
VPKLASTVAWRQLWLAAHRLLPHRLLWHRLLRRRLAALVARPAGRPGAGAFRRRALVGQERDRPGRAEPAPDTAR